MNAIPDKATKPKAGRPRKKKTYCPDCQEPRPGLEPRICDACLPFHRQAFQQKQAQLMDGRTLSIGGKVSRKPGCE